ncbi:cytochrome c oxidase subunit II [Tranquillimonas alkanivorans]|uniref:Cytochrome c oxidase subunit 2 n=1 Tax=Tranquillimonas alkanivorans TaxID=441119 RepID=A0A1I5M5J7_9RHOB|nr:cytochrome c oxidase subunit II [Tranquillimonas alkanivorans]SFP04884.1 cytochrome c oxidase subunit 2 [Tranquillimonas alkanivorans]
MRFNTSLKGLAAAAFVSLAGQGAMAQDAMNELPIIGKPDYGATGFQPAATDLAADLQALDGLVLIIITAIVLFVSGLLVAVLVRYNRKRNPVPARFTHNTPIEVTWTLVPILILLFIGAFSLPVLFDQQEIPEADVTVKATGYQWYWGYEYPDHDFGYDSFMIGYGSNYVTDEIRAELQEQGYSEDEFRLAVDNAMVVPVDSTVVVQVTGADVIHSWTVPAFGVKQDGIPGRLAELWFEAKEEGVYFGQCSELCGKDHAYMPITVKVVSQEAYDAWIDAQVEAFAGTPRADAGVKLASAE